MSVLAIKGHSTRGKEVIEILEMLGGNNRGCRLSGKTKYYYYIGTFNFINYTIKEKLNDSFTIFTFEEFREKFPYEVGDRVRVPEYESEVCISKMYWDGNEVQYEVVTDEVEWYSAAELNKFNEPTKKETVEDIVKIDIPKGYEFAGVDDDNQHVVFEKIGHQYPKTYEECCEILNICPNGDIVYAGNWVYGGEYLEKHLERIRNFQKLLICRDAYWKIAGWNPKVKSDVFYMNTLPSYLRDLFPMPTEEMRDAFLENFGYLIELCKELL